MNYISSKFYTLFIFLYKKKKKEDKKCKIFFYTFLQVLCEVESALTVRAPDIKIVDVTRTVMASEYRNMKDETYRDLRDWIIFRDYMNCLEYLTDVCEFFKKLKDN